MKKCPECLAECPAGANRCSSCGKTFPSMIRKITWGIAFVLIAFLAWMALRSVYDNGVKDSDNRSQGVACSVSAMTRLSADSI